MGKSKKNQGINRCDYVLPSAPSLSEYYSESSPYSPYAEFTIPPPPSLPLPDLPPPMYPLREPHVTSSASSSSQFSTSSTSKLIGERAANFDVPFSKIKKRQANPRKPFNPITLTRRSCTDLFCCFLLLLFIAGWVVVAVFGFMWGKPERLIHPTDSLGRQCGHNRKGLYDLSDRPYLLFFDLTKCVSYTTVLTGCPTPQVCVQKCPTEYFSYLQLQFSSSGDAFISAVREHVICRDNFDVNLITNFAALKAAVEDQQCSAYTVKSAAVLGRCMPEVFVDAEAALADATSANSSLDKIITSLGGSSNSNGMVPTDLKVNQSTVVLDGVVNSRAVLQKVAADLSVSWYQILVFYVIAAVISFLWTILMRILGGFMIWLSIFVLLGILGGGSGYCWYRYYTLNQAGAINDYSFQPAFNLYFEMPTTWMVIGIISAALLLILFVIFLFVRSRIKLAVAVIEETSRALGTMLSTLFFPLVPVFLHVVVFGIFGTIGIWLASSGEENCRSANPLNATDIANGPPCDCDLIDANQGVRCHYVNLTRDSEAVTYMQLYNLFACFWMSCFVGALSDIVLAGAFASYYWAFNKPKDVPALPVIQSMGRAVRYHLGSLAFGSLIIAIVKIIRAILEFLYQKLHGSQNRAAQIAYGILQCFFFCLEKVLRALTKNAYIMIAMYGYGFCSAARDSFSLIARNIIRSVVLNRVVGFLLFIGKATVTAGLGVVSWYWFSGKWVIDGFPQVTLYYYFVPIIIVVIGTYCICDLFFEVFEMGTDTIFLCFLEDSESNDGSESKPYYMSEQLKKLYGKENKF